ncbi:pggt1b [Trichonephila clavipes]|nr:pggt1b [Trichonephila clavipes]
MEPCSKSPSVEHNFELNDGRNQCCPTKKVDTAGENIVLAPLMVTKLQLIDSTMPRKYCIYTDSMSVLEALENYNDRCHPVVCTILHITSRLYSKGFDIVFCWLPSHVGIIGNKQADSAAKSATTHLPLAVPLSDMKRVIMHHILRSGRNHGVSSWITNCTL